MHGVLEAASPSGIDGSLAQAITTARYAIEPVRDRPPAGGLTEYEADNPGQSWRTVFAKDEVRISSSGENSWGIGIELKGYGRGENLIQLTTAAVEARGDRIELTKRSRLDPERSVLVEWYFNSPVGLEQGFTLAAPPRSKSSGRVRIVLQINGNLQSEMSSDGTAVQLRDARGRHVATYDQLRAWDATGRPLVAEMRQSSGDILLEVDDAGASYPITVDPILQEVKLSSAESVSQDALGFSVAINGSTALVGEPQHNVGVSQRYGVVFVFVRNGATWSLQQKLMAFDLAPIDLRYVHAFGVSVGLSGNTAIVGSQVGDTMGNTQQGVAYIFDRKGKVWSPRQKLVAGDGPGVDSFGESVAISGETAIVGSHVTDPSQGGTAPQRGAAYVFTRQDNLWTRQQRLVASDGAILDSFGYSVSLNRNTAIVGAFLAGNTQTEAKGAAYVFIRTGSSWTEQKKLTPPSLGGGEFGYSVSVSGNTAIIGTPGYDAGPIVGQGTAYVFTRNGSVWSAPQQLLALDGAGQDAFGTSVSVSGDTAVVGSHLKDLNGNQNQGKAYVFQRTGSAFAPTQELTASDGQAFQTFGQAVAISGESILIGAPGDNSARGAAYVYQTKDTDGDGIPDDWEKFGITVNDAGNVVGTGNLLGQGTFIDLKKMGADPMHKDLFVHADWMAPRPGPPMVVIKPNARTMAMVSDAFQKAPVTNPDGRIGINLHVDLGPNSVMNPLVPAGMSGRTWGPLSRSGEEPYQATLGSFDSVGTPPVQMYNWSAFDILKSDYFEGAKRQSVFHYAVFCNNYDGVKQSSGLSRGVPGGDFLVALGQIGGGTEIALAGTFMHEFGHNLGLQHGGDEDAGYKPNYLSIMNYSFQLEGLVRANVGRTRSIDYSRRLLPPLNEAALDENVGISEPAFYTFWKCPESADPYYALFLNGAVDWNLDGVLNIASVAVDINHELSTNRRTGCAGTTSVLTGAEDWSVLRFDGGGKIGNSAGVDLIDEMSTVVDEAPIDDVLASVPPPIVEAENVAPHDVGTVTTQTGPDSLTALFDGSGSTAVDGTIVSWIWDFGDGTTGSGAMTQHTYASPGYYCATLTVTDSNGHVNLVPVLICTLISAPPTPSPTPTPAPGPGDVDSTYQAAVTATYGTTIYATAVQADGKIIVGGQFESFGGYARRNIARLNADGSCDPTFDPALALTDVFDAPGTSGAINRKDLPVYAIALQSDGKILAGLQSTRGLKNGVSAASKMIVRLNPDGSVDPTFDTVGFDLEFSVPVVKAITFQTDNKILVGGAFLYENAGTKNALVRLNSDGSLDPSFLLPTGLVYGGPNFASGLNTGTIDAIVLTSDGKIIIGGAFEDVGLTERAAVARLNIDGSLDQSYNAQNSSAFSKFSEPAALALQPDGKVIISGYLTPDGSAPFPFARLNADGSRDSTFSTAVGAVSLGSNTRGCGVALQSDGNVLVAGQFESSALGGRSRVARLKADGTLDPTFDTPGMNGSSRFVYGLALLAGKAIVVGQYNAVAGVAAESIVEFNTDGSRDLSFQSNGPGVHAQVHALTRQADGKWFVGFSAVAGNSQVGASPLTKLNSARMGGIGRLNADGTTDPSFTSPFDESVVSTIGLQSDGKPIISGSFRLIGSSNEMTFARLNPDGTLDSTFAPSASATGGPIAIQPDGKILTSGVHSSGFPGVLRLENDGTYDNSFSAPLPNGGVGQIALRPDGRVVIGGFFYLGDGRPARLGLLNADGSFDPAFDPGTGPDDTVWALLVQTDGKIIIAGKFYNYNGIARNRIARINSDGSLDTSFVPYNPDTTNDSEVRALALQVDGKLVVGSYYGGRSGTLPPNRVFRLNADGGLDSSFPLSGTGTEGISNNVNAIGLQEGGKILIGGEFGVTNSKAHLGIARLLGKSPTALANISTRLRVEQGKSVLIGGFIITGTGQKRLLLRAMGPSLPVSGRLEDPTLELYSASGQSIATNDNWMDAPNRQEIIDSTIPPVNDLESAILMNLNPGAYTAIVRGISDTTGVALVEAYDLDPTASSTLGNISTRGLVQTGENVMIAGTIVLGQTGQRVIVRALGPSLSIAGYLADPTLELRDGNGSVLAANDNWRSDQESEIIATGIPPADDMESAVVATLPANGAAYTAIVSGAAGTTGVAVVEVYAIN